MQNGIIILPISDPEQDARPLTAEEKAAAVRSLCAQVQQTGDQISAATAQQVQQISPERLAALADQLDQLAQRVQAAADYDEPPRTELDTIEAEAAALLDEYPELLPLPPFTEGIPQPIEKVTREIFKRAKDGGQRYGEYRITQNKNDPTSPLIAILGFSATKDSLERLDALTGFDRLVLLAIGALCENKVMCFSYSQLWWTMGRRGECSSKDRKRIKHSLQKLAACRIYLKQTAFDFPIPDDFALIEYRAKWQPYRGQPAGVIQMLAVPAWLDIARAQNCITKIPLDAYADGTTLTDQSATLSVYLLQEIAHMKNQPTFPRYMRLDTIAGEIGVNCAHREAKRRLCKKIEAKLDHYTSGMKNPYIDGWTRYENGYKIKIPTKAKKGNKGGKL